MRTTRLLAVAAVSTFLAACNNGGATPPPFPPKAPGAAAAQPAAGARDTEDFQRNVALGYFQASCADEIPGFARCYAYQLTPAGRAAVRQREAQTGTRTISATAPGGYGPAQLQAAYNLGASIGGGAGRTVAIVDAFDDPNAESDLATYRAQFGLPPCTTANGCFRKVNQTGGTAPPATDVSWSQEISLDVDMVSANCPNCHILLVEASSASFNDLATAVNTAAGLGAFAISNSYGGNEFSTETSLAAAYNHPGVAITASAGDNGFGAQAPAAFNTLTAVGGTSLTTASNPRGWSETVWSGTGSGCSAYIAKPSWQHDTGCARRMIGDVAYDANPNTGVAVYDTFGEPGWLIFGGTSVSAPAIAAIYALVGTPVNDASITYAHTSSLFDVTSGSNGRCRLHPYFCTGEVGYDGPTGNGTPNGTGAF